MNFVLCDQLCKHTFRRRGFFFINPFWCEIVVSVSQSKNSLMLQPNMKSAEDFSTMSSESLHWLELRTCLNYFSLHL